MSNIFGQVGSSSTSSAPSLSYAPRAGFICRYTSGAGNEFVASNGTTYNNVSTISQAVSTGFCPKWITTAGTDSASVDLYDGDGSPIYSTLGFVGGNQTYLAINFDFKITALPPSSTKVCLFSIGGAGAVGNNAGGCIYVYHDNVNIFVYTDTNLTQGYSWQYSWSLGSVNQMCIVLGPSTVDMYIAGTSLSAKTQLASAGFLRPIPGPRLFLGNNSTAINGTTAWIGVQIYAFSMIASSTAPSPTAYASYSVGPYDISSTRTILSSRVDALGPLNRVIPITVPWQYCQVSASAHSTYNNTVVLTNTSASPALWHYGTTPYQAFYFDTNCYCQINYYATIFGATGYQSTIYVTLNGGATPIAQNGCWNNSAGVNSIICSCSVVWRFLKGDYIQFYTYNSGATGPGYNVSGGYVTLTAFV